jgi:hypothetical protein
VIDKILEGEDFKDSVSIPKTRMWYDMLIHEDDTSYPVNIKIIGLMFFTIYFYYFAQ